MFPGDKAAPKFEDIVRCVSTHFGRVVDDSTYFCVTRWIE